MVAKKIVAVSSIVALLVAGGIALGVEEEITSTLAISGLGITISDGDIDFGALGLGENIKTDALGNPDFIPFGFSQKKRKKARMTDLKRKPEEIKILKKIFRLRKKKKSFGKIGNIVDLPKSKVYYILNNPIYQTIL